MPLVWRVLDRKPVHSLSDYLAIGGGIASRLARQAPPAETIDLLCSSGLRGRGGAGFPTGTKWKTVAASRSTGDVTTVVVNAAEGEPGTFKDRALLRTNPYRVLEGAIVAAVTMQTDQVRIGIKATFGREIERLTAAIAEMGEAGWLHDLDIELVLGPSAYLFGEETALLEVVEGRQPFPRVTPPYRRGLQEGDTRSSVGVRLASIGGTGGAPALVDNVETLANVPLIVAGGAEWFREIGTERSPGTIVCTVSGATRRSGVGELPMGSTLREAITVIGWGPRQGHEVQVVLAGTANALIPARLLDTPLTYEALRDAGSGLGSAGFIVFDDTTEPAAIAAGVARFLAVESCGQCEPCKIDGLIIADQLDRALREAPTSIDDDALRHRIDTVAIGARCNLAQQQASVAASLLELYPRSLGSRSHGSLAATTEPVTIAPIADLIGGRAILDPRQRAKQPDWSYEDSDSGAVPAARLGNTPVHIEVPSRSRQWPEWSASLATNHPLELLDDAHWAIDALIELALAADDQAVEGLMDDVAIAVRTHIDVTQRVLYPMARRIDDEEGELLADAAETQERRLSHLVIGLDRSNMAERLQDICVEMQVHAHLDDQILELLRARLDPSERSSLADGLAAALTTSTVSRLRRTASKFPAHLVEPPDPRPLPDVGEPLGGHPAHVLARDDSPRLGPPPAVDDKASPEPVPNPVVARIGPIIDRSPGSDKMAAITRILVGVDGSAAAAAA
ncbi:MAG: NADH-ubiquinone oxidoreductase-F iron-sulfur binding region domain-containing protein, partial [Ilumatobacteraceae bacterium]